MNVRLYQKEKDVNQSYQKVQQFENFLKGFRDALIVGERENVNLKGVKYVLGKTV